MLDQLAKRGRCDLDQAIDHLGARTFRLTLLSFVHKTQLLDGVSDLHLAIRRGHLWDYSDGCRCDLSHRFLN
jgi:hypothetical protein